MQTHFSPSPQAGPNQNQETVIFLLQAVNRPGIDSLIDYLLESDYFTAPASTRFHNSFPGGLCLHSLNLFHAFNDANKQLMKPLPPDSVVICGLLHDLCKVNVYLPTGKGYKSVKGTTGHATLSLSRIEEHIRLTPQEDDVIRYLWGSLGSSLTGNMIPCQCIEQSYGLPKCKSLQHWTWQTLKGPLQRGV